MSVKPINPYVEFSDIILVTCIALPVAIVRLAVHSRQDGSVWWVFAAGAADIACVVVLAMILAVAIAVVAQMAETLGKWR